jgi:hypothetical protein
MTESTAQSIDAWCKIATAAALIIAGGWTLITYLTTRRDAAQTALIEARKPFLDKRLELYMVAASAAATVASLHATPAEVEAAKDRCWNLYYGPLALVEDVPVEQAMMEFAACIVTTVGTPPPCSAPELRDRSLALAHSCRDSIAANWNVKLSNSDLKELRIENLLKIVPKPQARSAPSAVPESPR